MKIAIFIGVMAVFAIANGVFVPPRHGHKKIGLLGSDHCTWGPTHWCRNLTNSAQCHATRHCIDTVWTHMTLPPDNTSICQICLDMVKQARDQLESNETQELIKEVFEGTCALIHLKPIVEECDKIADDYIPDLIETLASEMNPQVVCSVAGLCNSDKVHRLLAEQSPSDTKIEPVKRDSCQDCYTVVGLAEEKFNKLSRDEVLQNMLMFCGKMGSFSDGCSNIVVTYFQEIYTHIQDHFNPNEVCLMSGECSAKFHVHKTANVEITHMSHVGYVPVKENKEKDDLPCELCEQLVGHLKDLLIANTTEEEFDLVLQGLCKQTGKFSSECLSLVQQYYHEIYDYLVNGLNSSEVCTMIGICNPSSDKKSVIAPLLPSKSAKLALTLSQPEEKPLVHIKINSEKSTLIPPVLLPVGLFPITEQPQRQLPIDYLMPPNSQLLYNKNFCQICQYFLHFIQEQITEPATEEKIKGILDGACKKLPESINSTCVQFVDTYEPALMALFAQEIDPSQICPMIKVCPAESEDVELFMQAKSDSKCPLCLVAVTKLESIVKDKKTKESIKEALEKVCSALPKNMKDECQDFVQTYTDELVEMLIADLSPEEVCTYLKLCSGGKSILHLPHHIDGDVGGNIETNAIHDNTINGRLISNEVSLPEESSRCAVCEFVMAQIEKDLQDKISDEELKTTVSNVCSHLPDIVSKQCSYFIDQYKDNIIQILVNTRNSNEVCPALKYCKSPVVEKLHEVQISSVEEGPQCVICEFIMNEIDKDLEDKATDEEIKKLVHTVCDHLPSSVSSQCNNFVSQYGDAVIQLLIETMKPNEICPMLKLCSNQTVQKMHVEILECPICQMTVEAMEKILANPKIDHDVEHVLEKTCRGVPFYYRNKCVEIIEKYGDTMIDMLIHYTDKDFVCQKIGYCKSTLHEIIID